MTWVHVSAQADAYGTAGWLIVPTRSAPLLGQRLAMMVPSFALRWLPHFEGWWVSADVTPAMFRALNGALHAHDLCSHCAQDGAPCEEASATALERAARAAHTQSMMTAARVEREHSARYYAQLAMDERLRGASRNHGIPSSAPWSRYDAPPSGGRARVAPAPPPREDPVKLAAKTLGIAWPATKAEIQKAFRHAINRTHPDLGGTDGAAVVVIAARTTLLSAV